MGDEDVDGGESGGKGRGRGGDGESLRRRAVPAPPSSDDEADGGGYVVHARWGEKVKLEGGKYRDGPDEGGAGGGPLASCKPQFRRRRRYFLKRR